MRVSIVTDLQDSTEVSYTKTISPLQRSLTLRSQRKDTNDVRKLGHADGTMFVLVLLLKSCTSKTLAMLLKLLTDLPAVQQALDLLNPDGVFMSPLHVVDVRGQGRHGVQSRTDRVVALCLVVRVGLHVLRRERTTSQ